jgi:hypothetical protein
MYVLPTCTFFRDFVHIIDLSRYFEMHHLKIDLSAKCENLTKLFQALICPVVGFSALKLED